MGFGSGHTTYHRQTSAHRYSDGARVGMMFSNDMCAHVWAQQSQDFGRTKNGNFSFTGRRLNSYDGFTVAMMLPTGLGERYALITSESFSVSTTGHTNDGASASRDKIRFYVPELRRVADYIDALGDFVTRNRDPGDAKAMRDKTRRFLVEHAAKLGGHALAPGEWRSYDGSEETGEQLGAIVAKLAGLPAASWEKAKRERERLDAKATREAAAKKDKATRARLVQLADMPAHEWRSSIALNSGRYSNFYTSLAKELWHLIRYAKEHGYSARRIEMLKARRATVYAKANGYTGLEHVWRIRQQLRQSISDVRGAMRVFTNDGRGLAGVQSRESALRTAIAALARLSEMTVFPAAARERLTARRLALLACHPGLQAELAAWQQAERAEREREQAERLALRQQQEAEQRIRNAAAIQSWLAGEPGARPVAFDAESGGAAMRIIGDELQTSRGATVPLAHAVKAFRFVKLCRERGESWHRNGATVRVGHFQIDSVAANGDFVAGCHDFKWPEVERVAKLAGVFDCEASAAAVEHSEHA